MTKIIGHRGAAGLALENSLESIKAALKLPVDGIEFDIRRTKDGKLVLMHDWNTARIADKRLNVGSSTLAELRKISLRNGEKIPTLEEVLEVAANRKPLSIDIKSTGVTDELLRQLDAYPKADIILSSRLYDELKKLHKARPDIPFIVQHHFDSMEIIRLARNMGAKGICLNMWLMNPIAYRLAKRYHLEIHVYTINSRWIMRFFQVFYPDAIIITNHPERML
ncbi:MAG TPA: glycerophosphodiester phosphodiesterase [Candidatus Saccharimonadales bacterium]